MLFGCSKYENRMRRRFLKRFQKSVEGRLREHVHLVYDIYAVLSYLWRDPHLVHQVLDVIYPVVRSRIQFMDAIRTSLRK